FTAITDLIPDRYDFSEGVTGVSIGDGGGDMYDYGNQLNTNLEGAIPYSDGVILSDVAQLLGPGGAYFTRKHPGLFVFAADLGGISTFSITGNLGADGSGNSDGAVLSTSVAGTSFKGFFTRVWDAFDPSINHLVIVRDSPGVAHSYLGTTSFEDHIVSGLQDTDRLYYLLFASQSGRKVEESEALEIMNAFLSLQKPDFAKIKEPAGGTLDPSGAHTLELEIDATNLEGLLASTMSVESGGSITSVPINLTVTPAPGLRTEQDGAIDFGRTFTEAVPVSEQVTILNAGTQELIADRISVRGAGFSLPDAAGFQIPPGGRHEIEVQFSPFLSGIADGTLTITSNDPSDPTADIQLTGEGVDPPLDISPRSQTTSIYAGDTAELSLGLSNPGLANIAWELPTAGEISLEGVLGAIDEHAPEITSLVPDLHLFTDGVAGGWITDGGNDMYDLGNRLWTSSGGVIPYRDGNIANHRYLGTEGRYFTRKRDGLFAFAADLDGVESFEINGSAGKPGSIVEGREFQLGIGTRRYSGFFKRSFGNVTNATVNHLVIVPDQPGATHTYSSDPTRDDHEIQGIAGGGRIYYLLFSSLAGKRVGDATARQIMEKFVNFLEPSVFTVDTQAASLGGGESANLTLAIDTSRIPHGTDSHDLEFDVGSEIGPIPVRVTIEIMPAAGLSIDTGELEFASSYVGLGSSQAEISITNIGSLPMDITALATDSPAFSVVDPSDLQIAPGESREIGILFHPTSSGAATGSLTFSSNDPSDPSGSVALSGLGIDPPLRLQAPASPPTLLAGDTASVSLSLTNQSAAPADWDVSTGEMSLEDILETIDARGIEVSSLVPDRYNFVGGTASQSIFDGGNNMYSNGNFMFSNLDRSLTYIDGVVGTSPTGTYFTRKIPGLFVFASDLAEETQRFMIRGATPDAEATAEHRAYELWVGHTSYSISFKRKFGTSGATVNQLIIVPNANLHLESDAPSSPTLDDHRVDGLAGQRLYYLLFSTREGRRIDDPQVDQIARAFIAILNSTWLELAGPGRGQLAPADSVNLDLPIDSAGLEAGLHTTELTVSWDDPSRADPGQFPVTVDVVSAPGLRLDQEARIFAPIMASNETASTTILIRNDGTEALDISGLEIDGASAFTLADSSDFQIQPRTTHELEIIYSP
ncbi:MAG: choice-of-anchor D domain-containing protein, partial [Verrucomicrobiales bacterium]